MYIIAFGAISSGIVEIMAAIRDRLILPAVTALGIRLSHASREGSALGKLLSNTWIICP